jgi:phosphoribosylglycinamide formyltransferase-1
LKWAIFISGFGSNLQALLDLNLPEFSVALVISNNSQAYGLQRAKKYNVPTIILPKPIQSSDWKELSHRLKVEKIDRIFLLGFLRIVPSEFIKDWENKILNLHPSLLPAYPGLKSIEKSYQDGAAMGVTVHWVTEGLDEGEILLQEKILESADQAIPVQQEQQTQLEQQTQKVQQSQLEQQTQRVSQKHKVTLSEAEALIHKLEHKLVIEAVKLCQKKQES